MRKKTRRNQHTDLPANAPQADGFSWSETQTGISSRPREPHDLRGDGVEHAVTMLDYEGSPVVTAPEVRERHRAVRPEI